MAERITLYTSNLCPYAHRAELALEEAGAKYTKHQVDLFNKPEWYAPRVNAASKVPALAYGGPDVPADQPSPDSIKLAESLILVEFVADLYPNTILPADPVKRAKARFFIDAVSNKFGPAYFKFTAAGTGDAETLFDAIQAIQDLLPDDGGYVLGGDEFSIADISVASFFARLETSVRTDAGAFKVGEGKKFYETLYSDDKYKKYRDYFARIKARDSFKKTYEEDVLVQFFKDRFRS